MHVNFTEDLMNLRSKNSAISYKCYLYSLAYSENDTSDVLQNFSFLVPMNKILLSRDYLSITFIV